MTEPDPTRDDFSKIKKITRPIAQGLYDLGILHYADLASQSPKKLAERLRARNVAFVSEQRIEREDWPGQARELAARNGQGMQPGAAALPEAADSRLNSSPPEGDALEVDLPMETGQVSWRELGDFFVSFGEEISAGGVSRLKTRVHFSQADRDIEWDGIVNGEQLIQWMISQADLPPAEPRAARPLVPQKERPANTIHLPPEIEALLEPRPQEEPALLNVSNLWVSYVKQAGSARRMVRIEADVDAQPEGAASIAAPIPVMTSIYLVNTQAGESKFYETSAVTLSQYDLPYAFRYDFPVPPPGRYQLYLLLKVTSADHAPTLKQGPLVRVEG